MAAADPIFTPEQIRDDGVARVAKTGAQVSLSVAIIGFAQWVAHQAGWHGEMPLDVQGYATVILTTIAGALSNLRRLRAK